MYKDLKEFAENEETIKQELNESKNRQSDLESLVEDLRERSHH